MTVSVETVHMAKSRPSETQSERSVLLKATLPYDKYMHT